MTRYAVPTHRRGDGAQGCNITMFLGAKWLEGSYRALDTNKAVGCACMTCGGQVALPRQAFVQVSRSSVLVR